MHVLLNNAAIQSPKGKRGAKTEEGFEVRIVTCLSCSCNIGNPLRLQQTSQEQMLVQPLCELGADSLGGTLPDKTSLTAFVSAL